MPEETTAIRLRKALADKNMKAIELSEKTGLSRGAISQYLSGKVTPKQDKIYILAEALGVRPAWLMGKNVSKNGYEVLEGLATLRENPEKYLFTSIKQDGVSNISSIKLHTPNKEDIIKAWLSNLAAGNTKALEAISRIKVVEATGELHLEGGSDTTNKLLNNQLQSLLIALESATPNGDGTSRVNWKNNK